MHVIAEVNALASENRRVSGAEVSRSSGKRENGGVPEALAHPRSRREAGLANSRLLPGTTLLTPFRPSFPPPSTFLETVSIRYAYLTSIGGQITR